MARSLIRAAAALTAALLVCAGAPAAAASPRHTARTPVQHLVFLMQENHTFDNYFGTRPGVDGIPAGTCMPVRKGSPTPCVKPHHVGPEGHADLDHSEQAFAQQYDGGKMDGFVSMYTEQGNDGSGVMGYYDDRDLPYYWNVADNYVLFDRFFSSAKDGSPPNHMFAMTGTHGTKAGSNIPADGWGNLPTIFDRLEASGVSWKFYVENYDPRLTFRNRHQLNPDRDSQLIWVPLLAYARYIGDRSFMSHVVDLSQYYKDVATGHLPEVSYIAPSGDSEHPPGRVQSGQRLVRSLVTNLMRSSVWGSSAFLWTYDDWGGYYDHVKPPEVDRYGYGFRVPALLVSPYAKTDYVDHTTLDFTSVLKFIEYNWTLKPLASRDAKANNILDAFDFGRPPRPPVLLGTARHPPPAVRPRTAAVYLSYSAVATLTVLLAAGALLLDRRRRATVSAR